MDRECEPRVGNGDSGHEEGAAPGSAAPALLGSDEALGHLLPDLLEAMGEGFALNQILCGPDGQPTDYRFLRVNSAFTELTGLGPDIVGRTALEVLPDLEAFWIETFGQVALTGARRQFEHYSQSLSRHYRGDAFSPRRGLFAVLFSDVTELKEREQALEASAAALERRVAQEVARLRAADEELQREAGRRSKAEDALQRSEQRWRSTFEDAAIGLAHVAPDGSWLEVNRRLCETLGYPREELLEMTFQDITHPDDLEADLGFVQQVLAGEIETYSMEKRYLRTDGSVVPANLTVSLVRDGGGAPDYFISAVEDISERKQIEQRRRESEERLRRTVLEAPHPLMVHAEDGEVLLISKAWTLLTGYTLEDIPTTDAWTERAYGPRKDAVREVIARRFQAEAGTHDGEFVVRTKAGSERIWDFRSTPLGRTEDGRRLAMSMAHDVTERKRSEANIRKLQRALESKVAELEAANRELESFSYSVSHDLRSPLRAIDGFSRILVDDYADDLDADARRYLELVRDNARKMGRLIDDLLAFSRLGKKPLAVQEVDLAALVHRAFETARNEHPGRAELILGELPRCHADPALLEQVCVNLLSNALKFSRDRDPAVIEVGSLEEDGRRAYFVRDNGVGFDMRYADKLFGVFQRLHREDEFEGTGVGLALVQRIVHRHGGHVWAEAEPGRGATLYFTLGGEREP